jgi:hypothetical protein
MNHWRNSYNYVEERRTLKGLYKRLTLFCSRLLWPPPSSIGRLSVTQREERLRERQCRCCDSCRGGFGANLWRNCKSCRMQVYTLQWAKCMHSSDKTFAEVFLFKFRVIRRIQLYKSRDVTLSIYVAHSLQPQTCWKGVSEEVIIPQNPPSPLIISFCWQIL